MEAGGVELKRRIDDKQLADSARRSKRRKLTNSDFLVHGLYTEFIEDSEEVRLTHV